ncbi:MAG: hypothetical protein AAF329_12555 [Cyanobacteria bacterium P01_A01_bin.17]
MNRKQKPVIPSRAELVTLGEASHQLGKGFSRSSMLRRIDSGEWQEGIHWVDARRKGSVYRIIKINLAAVLTELATPAAFRQVGGDDFPD